MAITKNHPINSTLKKAIAYICNPDKTDDKLLIYSYGCSPETADIEFEWTRQKAIDPHKGGSEHLARHFIQAFEPGETTPDQAHQIGKQLADEVLGGKYEYVLTTHIDKWHIHNHIIFNDVSFVDYKRSHINKKWYYKTRRISDRLCDELGLSVIPAGKNKGKSYVEYVANKNNSSWKSQIRNDIDKAVSRSTDVDDFLLRLEIKGYEVKRGKHISFCPKDKERFIRGKTLGYRYTEEQIRDRIAKNKVHRPKQNPRSVNLIIDIENCIKALQSKGYEHWAKIHNLKQASKTLNFLTEHNINSYVKLETLLKNTTADFNSVSDEIKAAEKQINDISVKIKYLKTHTEFKPIYDRYCAAKDKEAFRNSHRGELALFETAAKKIQPYSNLSMGSLEQEQTILKDKKAALYNEYKTLKKKTGELDIIKINVDSLLNTSLNKQHEKDITLE